MATHSQSDNLDLEEQRVRIRHALDETEKFSAETRRIVAEMTKAQAETKFLPLATVFQGFIAMAALLGAGAAMAKLFFS